MLLIKTAKIGLNGDCFRNEIANCYCPQASGLRKFPTFVPCYRAMQSYGLQNVLQLVKCVGKYHALLQMPAGR